MRSVKAMHLKRCNCTANMALGRGSDFSEYTPSLVVNIKDFAPAKSREM